jgi:hypothetical protein
MGLTARGAFPYPDITTNWKTLRAQLRDIAERVAAAVALFGFGALDTRPSAALARQGTFWITDTGALSYCTGSAWLNVPLAEQLNQTFLGRTAKAADSELLDGLDSSHFASAAAVSSALAGKLPLGGKAADAELLDGVDSGAFARRDQNNTFNGTLNVAGGGELREAGVRVFSPRNPPPARSLTVVKPSATELPANQTPQDDPHLRLPVQAGRTYLVDALLAAAAGPSFASVLYGLTSPGGAGILMGLSPGQSGAVVGVLRPAPESFGQATYPLIRITGSVRPTADGELVARWAGTSAALVIDAGSYLTAEDVTA